MRQALWAVVLLTSPVGASLPTPAQTQDKLTNIITSDEYSDSTLHKEWQRITPNTGDTPKWLDDFWAWLDLVGQLFGGWVGVVGKGLAVLFLLFLVWWAYRTRQTWLLWFGRLTTARIVSTAEITPQTLPQVPLWQDLPPKDKLASAINVCLAKHEWLSAVSLLYQGTLRELGVVHELPIGKHQTEEECVWLLCHAKHAHPKEMAYFDELVAMWRASAYGRRVPVGVEKGDYASIVKLLNTWQTIYGGGRV